MMLHLYYLSIYYETGSWNRAFRMVNRNNRSCFEGRDVVFDVGTGGGNAVALFTLAFQLNI